MIQLAALLSIASAVALLLGFVDLATAIAMSSIAVLCLGGATFVATMLLTVCCTLAGRASHWLPPSG